MNGCDRRSGSGNHIFVLRIEKASHSQLWWCWVNSGLHELERFTLISWHTLLVYVHDNRLYVLQTCFLSIFSVWLILHNTNKLSQLFRPISSTRLQFLFKTCSHYNLSFFLVYAMNLSSFIPIQVSAALPT